MAVVASVIRGADCRDAHGCALQPSLSRIQYKGVGTWRFGHACVTVCRSGRGRCTLPRGFAPVFMFMAIRVLWAGHAMSTCSYLSFEVAPFGVPDNSQRVVAIPPAYGLSVISCYCPLGGTTEPPPRGASRATATFCWRLTAPSGILHSIIT